MRSRVEKFIKFYVLFISPIFVVFVLACSYLYIQYNISPYEFLFAPFDLKVASNPLREIIYSARIAFGIFALVIVPIISLISSFMTIARVNSFLITITGFFSSRL